MNRTRIAQLASHSHHLLERIIAKPELCSGDLDIELLREHLLAIVQETKIPGEQRMEDEVLPFDPSLPL